jgi:ABC-2 type transport system permease protein
MKQFIAFVQKEFYHVLRDRKTLLILFGMPLVQILIFGFALTNEVKDTHILIVDNAKDLASQKLITRIGASQYFKIEQAVSHHRAIEAAFRSGKVKAALVIPAGFGESLGHEKKGRLQIITDASDPNQANIVTSYLNGIIRDFTADEAASKRQPYQIIPETRMLYNPQLKGAPNYVPGVMALVLMLVCVMMTAVSIVREKEIGTMEILLVSPFKPILVIVAKAVPYLLLSLVNVVTILLLSVFVLELPIKGSILLLFAESTLFIITNLTLGIFISVRTNSQQVAMLISLMGMMLPTIMFSGFMFPIENMPLPLQILSNIIPAKWYYSIVKSIMIKGLGFSFIWKQTLILTGITLALLAISLKSFKTRLA